MEFISQKELESRLPTVLSSPNVEGRIEKIIVRRRDNERELRQEVFLSPDGGVEGDKWILQSKGKPDPRTQLTIMNFRILEIIAQNEERMQLAGDNIITNFDLSETNLPVGQKLSIGNIILEITDVPHTGCKSFAKRYGKDALDFINAPERKSMRLRGVYAQILKPGLIHVGDFIKKM